MNEGHKKIFRNPILKIKKVKTNRLLLNLYINKKPHWKFWWSQNCIKLFLKKVIRLKIFQNISSYIPKLNNSYMKETQYNFI